MHPGAEQYPPVLSSSMPDHGGLFVAADKE